MPEASTSNKLLALRRLGQSPWLDFISREILASGDLKRLIEVDGVTGVTTNPSIFEKAINSSTAYDAEIQRLAKEGKNAEEIYDALTLVDIAEASDLLRPVYRRSRGNDGFISIEVSPHCAYDAHTTVSCARRVFADLRRPNILIKIPATEPGAKAIEEALVAGINVNATLIFSPMHYERVALACLRALERRQEQGLAPGAVHSVASVFVSRIDTAVDKLLDGLAAQVPSRQAEAKALRGRAAVANSAIVYQRYLELFSGPEFAQLKNAGARVQKIVWGSTSTKDPAYADVKYVDEIIGRGTVNTIPLGTLRAFQDHGVARITLTKDASGARAVFEKLRGLGIDIDAVCQKVQEEGVKAFVDSHDTLIAAMEKKRRTFAP